MRAIAGFPPAKMADCVCWDTETYVEQEGDCGSKSTQTTNGRKAPKSKFSDQIPI